MYLQPHACPHAYRLKLLWAVRIAGWQFRVSPAISGGKELVKALNSEGTCRVSAARDRLSLVPYRSV